MAIARPARPQAQRLANRPPKRRAVYRVPKPPKKPPGHRLGPVKPPPAAGTPGAPAPVAPVVKGPPPRTAISAGNILGAGTSRDQAIAGANQGIVQAALKLGDPNTLAALKANPEFAALLQTYTGGPLTGSIWDELARGEESDLTTVDNTANDANAFFSGFRLQDRQKTRDQFSASRASALSEYQQAVADYNAAKAQAIADYEAAQREADMYDLETELANEPPEVAVPGKPKAKPKPKAKAKAKAKPKGSPRAQGPSRRK